MDTVLISTDFSEHARNAAVYGYHIAQKLGANVVLCNAIIVPAEIPQVGIIGWPDDESNSLKQYSETELAALQETLQKNNTAQQHNPTITCVSEFGILTQVVKKASDQNNAGLVVLGTHGSSDLNTLLIGNHSRKMIDANGRPLLLVPSTVQNCNIKRIAFATDFKQPEMDIVALKNLLPIAKAFDAEIWLTNIYDETHHAPGDEDKIKHLLKNLCEQVEYKKIYYNVIKSKNAGDGLNWICESGKIDLLAMVHRSKSLLKTLFTKSHTQHMANHINIPLLVFTV